MIRFVCPDCGKRYQVAVALAGRRTQCKACGSALTIPAAEGGGAAAKPTGAGRPSAVASAARTDVDDPYGLGEAAESEAGEAEPVLTGSYRGRGRGSAGSGAGVPAWVWIAGGGAGAAVVLVGAAMMLGGGGGNPQAAPAVAGASGADAIPEDTETSRAPTSSAAATYPVAKVAAPAASAASASWRVPVDPPAFADGPYPPNLELSIPVPDHYGDPVLYPTTASPFVLLGDNSNDRQRREVFDLRSGASVGRVAGNKGSTLHDPMALSPDGRFLAARDISEKPYAVTIWSLADGGPALQTIPLAEEDQVINLLDFLGPDELLLVKVSGGKALVYNVQTGKPVRQFELPKLWPEDSYALSPGRKFMTLVDSHADPTALKVFDVTTGRLVGTQALPSEGTYDPNAKGVAFSDDGKALSVLFELKGNMHLMSWDVATGALESHHRAEGRDGFGDEKTYKAARNLQWLPDGTGWLVYDQAIVERSSGQRVWTVPFDERKQGLEEAPRKVLNAGRIAALVKQKDAKYLRSLPLPTDKIGAALAAARSGGSASDALLPPLAAVDVASAPAVAIPAVDVAWGVKPEATAAGAKPLAHKPIHLPAKATELIAMAFADAATAQAAALSGTGGRLNDKEQAQQGGQPRTVHRVNLATGQMLGKLEVPAVYGLEGISPDGTRLLLVPAQARDRVDVFAAADGKPVAGWRPAGAGGKVIWAAFLDGERVLTADPAGTLALWSLAGGGVKPVYAAAGVAQGAPALSPGRKWVAGYRDGFVLLLEAATGAVKGRIAAPSGDGSGLKALAFRPDGGELAAVVNNTVARFDLATGALVQETPCPVPAARVARLAYGGPKHLLIDDTALLDVERQRVVWFFRGGVPGQNSPDGAFWIAGNPQILGPAILNAFELPGRSVSQAMAEAFAPTNAGLIRPGGAVAVAVEGNPPRDGDGFRRGLQDRLAGRVRDLGVNVDDGAPVRLVASLREGASHAIELIRFGGGTGAPEKRNVNISDVEWEIALADGKGAPLGVGRGTVGVPFVMSLRLPPGENDWGGFFRQRLWEAARDQVAEAMLPFYAARKGGGAPLLLPGVTEVGYPSR